ncbi:MmyB family transcriptional regulator [Streptomyces sp. NPDC054855]
MFVRNGRVDILAANQLFRAFYTDRCATPGNQQNLARCTFLDPPPTAFSQRGTARVQWSVGWSEH